MANALPVIIFAPAGGDPASRHLQIMDDLIRYLKCATKESVSFDLEDFFRAVHNAEFGDENLKSLSMRTDLDAEVAAHNVWGTKNRAVVSSDIAIPIFLPTTLSEFRRIAAKLLPPDAKPLSLYWAGIRQPGKISHASDVEPYIVCESDGKQHKLEFFAKKEDSTTVGIAVRGELTDYELMYVAEASQKADGVVLNYSHNETHHRKYPVYVRPLITLALFDCEEELRHHVKELFFK